MMQCPFIFTLPQQWLSPMQSSLAQCPFPPSQHSWPPFATLVSIYHRTQYIPNSKSSKGATNTQVVIAMDNGCFNHPVATTSITFKFSSDTSVVPPTCPSSPNPVVPPTCSSSPNPAVPPTHPSSPNPSNLSDNSEISEVLVDAASKTSAALANTAPANAAAPIASTTPFIPSAIVPPRMTAGATQQWYAIIVGSQVGVYQGWYMFPPMPPLTVFTVGITFIHLSKEFPEINLSAMPPRTLP